MFAAAAALVRFSRAGMVPVRRARWTFPFSFLGALAGAQAVLWVRPDVLRPVVLVLLLAAVLLCVVAALVLKLSLDALRG